MRSEVVDKLQKKYPTLKLLQNVKLSKGVFNEGAWFIFETKPFVRSVEEAKLITSDLIKNKKVFVDPTGMIEHNNECFENHYIEEKISKVVENMRYQTYKVLLWENPTRIFNGQPLFIVIKPEISLAVYPDHPHINFSNSYIQDSLCYTDRPEDLGKDPYNKFSKAIDIVNTWLFKHELWLESKKLGSAIWIGGAVDIEFEKQFDYFRNPDGLCRCGNNLKYSECHLEQDFRIRYKIGPLFSKQSNEVIPFLDINNKFNVDMYRKEWKSVVDSKSAFLKEISRFF